MVNKKIFFVSNAQSIHTVKWVDYFIDRGYEVHLATFSTVNTTRCDNIYFLSSKNTSVTGGNYHYLFAIKKLSKILKDIKPDIINAHYSYSMGLISLLAKKISKINAKFSVVCHGSDVLAPPIPFIFNRINRYILTSCDKVFVVSDEIKDKVEKFGVDLEKIFTGQYGLSITNTNNTKDIDILSNRTYHPNSRIDFLLDCMKTLENRNLNIVFVIPNIDNQTLEKFILEYPYINFYKHVEYSKMLKLMGQTKVYISATKSDGTALSLLEAMKLKTIPLVSNIPSNRSWILDGINGYLFNGKVDFMIRLEAILNLNTDKQQNMIKINEKLLLEKADYKNQMKKIEDFLI
ncbi:MAG TPA: glycosyltransferase [Campylobacterales bacterium]|nr:glycosyltransferase [Campylobacterales bacterium]